LARGAAAAARSVPGTTAPRGAGSGLSAPAASLPERASKAEPAVKPAASAKPDGPKKKPRRKGLSLDDEKDLDALEELLGDALRKGSVDSRAAAIVLRRRPEAGGPAREPLQRLLKARGRPFSAEDLADLEALTSAVGWAPTPVQARRLARAFEAAQPPAPEGPGETWWRRLLRRLRELLSRFEKG
jgi:hypothetical protein